MNHAVKRGRWRNPLVAVLVLSALGALAQGAIAQYTVKNATLVSGAVTHARNACFHLSSSVGEPVAGPVSVGNYRLTSGFLASPPPASHDSLFNDSFEDCRA